ncbi:ActS/PrrB/RegB family redox-sensitive histidine kinase [Segnochrobactraceae bacterium EtOH-i3]
MALALDRGPGFGGRSIRLDTLIRLRWLAVAGQTATIVLVALGLRFPLTLGPALGLVAVSAWLNLFLRLRFPQRQRLSPGWTAVLLGYDLMQLAGLLYLTGGLENPFAFLLIAPVMISATALPPRLTFMLGALAILMASLLALHHHPLPWAAGESVGVPLIYVGGVWLALVSSLIFMGIYAFRVAEEARQLSNALTATELVLAREQHLNALDGMAAAAAHELGTPLATITLVAKEMESDAGADSPLLEDIRLLRSQAERCREILRKLTSLAGEPDAHFARMPLANLLEEVVEPHREFGIVLDVRRIGPPQQEPVGERNPAILYGLGNLIENAVDYADSRVDITADWSGDTVSIQIADDGPGFDEDIIDRLGDPYVTTRSSRHGGPAESSAGGMGLGFFIAKTLLERTGARLSLANRMAPETGAIVTIIWPRRAMDIPEPVRAPPDAPADT